MILEIIIKTIAFGTKNFI